LASGGEACVTGSGVSFHGCDFGAALESAQTASTAYQDDIVGLDEVHRQGAGDSMITLIADCWRGVILGSL